MAVFGKRVALVCALFLVALVSGFLLFPQQSFAPSSLPSFLQPYTSGSASPGSGLTTSSNDTGRLSGPSDAGPLAPVDPAPPFEAGFSYRTAGFDTSQYIAGPTFGSAFEDAQVSSIPTGAIGGIAPRSTTTIPILMYHYVRTVTNRKDILGLRLSVTSALFAEQMQYLADHGYTTLTMTEVYAILTGEEPRPARPVALTFDDGYRDFYTGAWPILKAHNFKATSYIITSFVGGSAYMTWDQIRELDATGMVDFGAHTEHHLDLRYLSSTRLWNEVDGSKLALQQELGHSVTDFCYPSGEYNARVIAAVQRAGFDTATTTHYGYRQNLNWEFALPRVRVTGPNGFWAWVASLPK
jgi:peptidoglycan/xylan/chitin deacetylase (PgdA/CDA1 family)